MIGKSAVGLHEELEGIHAELREKIPRDEPRGTVPAVHGERDGPRQRDIARHVVDELGGGDPAGDAAAPRLREIAESRVPELEDIGAVDRAFPAKHLETVELARIVTRRDHDPAADTPLLRGEIEYRGRDDPDIDNRNAPPCQSIGERIEEGIAARAHIPADHGLPDVIAHKGSGHGKAEPPHAVHRQIDADDASDVVLPENVRRYVDIGPPVPGTAALLLHDPDLDRNFYFAMEPYGH